MINVFESQDLLTDKKSSPVLKCNVDRSGPGPFLREERFSAMNYIGVFFFFLKKFI
jgi:hypothetical protein